MAAPEMATAPRAVRNPRRALAVVVGVVFIDLLGFGVVIPIRPYYVRSFGVSDVYIGLLAASYSLLQFVAAPYLGRLSDERGRRPVMMLSLVGSVVAGVAALFCSRMVAGAVVVVPVAALLFVRATGPTSRSPS